MTAIQLMLDLNAELLDKHAARLAEQAGITFDAARRALATHPEAAPLRARWLLAAALVDRGGSRGTH